MWLFLWSQRCQHVKVHNVFHGIFLVCAVWLRQLVLSQVRLDVIEGVVGWKWNGVDSLHIVLAFVQSRSTWRTVSVSKGQWGQKFSARMCMWCRWLLVGRRLWAQSHRKYLSLLRVGVACAGLDSLELEGLVHLQWLWLVHMQILWWIFLKGSVSKWLSQRIYDHPPPTTDGISAKDSCCFAVLAC